MEVNNFYIPTKVTDWADPLSKRVGERISQNNKAKEENLEQSRQLELTDQGVANLNMLKDLSQHAATIVSSLDKRAANKKAKDSETEKRVGLELKTIAHSPKSQEAREIALKGIRDENGVLLNEQARKAFLRKLKSEGYDAKVLDYIADASPSEILAIEKINMVGAVKKTWTGHSEWVDEKDPKAKEEWLTSIGGTKKGFQSDYYNYAINKLKKEYNYTDKFIAANGISLIHEQGETLSTLSDIQYKNSKLTESNAKSQEHFNAVKVAQKENPNAITEWFHDSLDTLVENDADGKPDYAAAKDKLYSRLQLAIVSGDFTQLEIAQARKGLNRGNVPAGKYGDVLLTDKQWDNLGKLSDAVSNKKIEINSAARISSTNGMISQCLSPQGCTLEQKQKALTNHLAAGGKEEDKEYKSLENLNLNAQTQEYYDQEKIEVDLKIKNGRVKFEELNIQNRQLAEETKKRLKGFETFKSDNGYNEGNQDDKAGDYVKDALTQTLAKGVSVPPNSPSFVRNHISQKIDKVLWEVYNNDQLTIADADARIVGELTREGLYVKATDTTNENRGILTANSEGDFPLFEAQYFSRSEKRGSTFAETEAQMKSVLKGKSYENAPGRTSKERLVNSGVALTLPEIIHQAQNPGSWTPDILLKSEVYGIEPSVLYSGKIKALKADVNNQDAQDAIKGFELDKALENLPTSDVEVRKFIENSGDKDLLAYQQQFGLHNFTPNQLTRLIELEKQFDNFGEKQVFGDSDQKSMTDRIKSSLLYLQKINHGI